MLFEEFSDLPERSTRKRKNNRVTRSARGRRKDESSDESQSEDEDEEVPIIKIFHNH